MPFTMQFCEPCCEAGVNTLADYVFHSEDTSLTGPLLGDPDYWPPSVSGHRLLCRRHYLALSADSQLDYLPAKFEILV